MNNNIKNKHFITIIFSVIGLIVFSALGFVLSLILISLFENIGIETINNMKLNNIIFAISKLLVVLMFVKISKLFKLQHILINIINIGIVLSLINIALTFLMRGEIFINGFITILSYAVMHDLSKRNEKY